MAVNRNEKAIAMSTRYRSRAVFSLCIVLCAFGAQGRARYVTPSGDDSRDGSSGLPWKTLAKAGEAAVAGDTVFVREGIYREPLQPHNSGTASEPVAFVACSGEQPIIDGTDISAPSIRNVQESGMVFIVGVDYIRVEGFKIQNSVGTGIWIMDANHVVIRKNHTYNTFSSGIIASEFGHCSDLVVDSNEVELACNDGGQECVSLSQTNGFVVSNNHIHDGGPGTHGGEGIDIKFGSHDGIVYRNHVHHTGQGRQGLYADAWSEPTRNIIFCENIVHDCFFGIGAASETGGAINNVLFYSNVVYDCFGPGMYLIVSIGPLDSLMFINNTLCNNGNPQWSGGLWIGDGVNNAKNIIVRNNLISKPRGKLHSLLGDQSGLTMENNMTDDSRGSTYAGHTVVPNIFFVDAPNGNFRLAANSPAIDAGREIDFFSSDTRDAAGGSRVTDGDDDGIARVDIGAYEYVSPIAVRYALTPTMASIIKKSMVFSTNTELYQCAVGGKPLNLAGRAIAAGQRRGATGWYLVDKKAK